MSQSLFLNVDQALIDKRIFSEKSFPLVSTGFSHHKLLEIRIIEFFKTVAKGLNFSFEF